MLDFSDLPCTFLVDCGSDISLIKLGKLRPTHQIYQNENCILNGIGANSVHTLGKTDTKIYFNDLLSTNQSFQVVDSSFPIPTDGILGRDFFIKHKCCIDYNTWLLTFQINGSIISIPIENKTRNAQVIPSRCEIIHEISVGNLL